MQVKYSPKFPPAGHLLNTRRQTEYIYKVCICVQGLQALRALQKKNRFMFGGCKAQALHIGTCLVLIYPGIKQKYKVDFFDKKFLLALSQESEKTIPFLPWEAQNDSKNSLKLNTKLDKKRSRAKKHGRLSRT